MFSVFFSFFQESTVPTGLEISGRQFPAISHKFRQKRMAWRRVMMKKQFSKNANLTTIKAMTISM